VIPPLQGTVVVTGARGFIGGHLLRRLRSIDGVDVVAVSREPQPDSGNVRWVTADLATVDQSRWQQVIDGPPAALLHLGGFVAYSHADAARASDAYRGNVLGTLRLLESLPAARRTVFASTLDVYAPPGDSVLSESTPTLPQTLYGSSKLFAEEALRFWCDQQAAGFAILRLGHIFGPGEERFAKLIPATIRQLLAGEAPVLYGGGEALRDYLYVDDVVEALLRAAVCDAAAGATINIVRGDSVAIREVVSVLAALTGFEGEIRREEHLPAGPSFRFDNSRMRELLGEWPLVDLADGLRLEVEHVRSLSAR
jgi:UDP-glucose 4-epimerase